LPNKDIVRGPLLNFWSNKYTEKSTISPTSRVS
jgi:hypothetical protein